MPGLTQLGPSGYFRYEHGRLFVLGDVGPPGPSYQPGHAHCDILSFELCWDGRPVIVDTGTSTYEAGARRLAERGTESHNTVQIGSMEQSEIWGGFRMARRGSVEQVDATPDRIVARIRAFPPVWARHERSWTFQGEQVAIDDRVTLARGRRTVARLHLHPDVEVEGSGDSWTAGGVRIRFEGATHVHREGYLYAPEFNRRISGTRLVAEFFDALRTVIGP
jgi:uncharacterized heparinase superfamily protein